jgi:hypothetical protein
MPCIFSEYNGMKSAINNKRKFWNYNKYMENEEYTFEQGVIEEIKKETSFSK